MPAFDWRARLVDYTHLLRLQRPIGALLLLWPTLWALWLAAAGWPGWRLLAIFTAGVWLTRSAGCAINDYADRGFDRHIARTRERPLAVGRIHPAEALALFALLMLGALAVAWPLGPAVLRLALPGLLLAAIYPFTKRVTQLPQAWLGVAFSWGIPMAYAAVRGQVDWGEAGTLMLANGLWVIAFDTLYAMVDRDDDVRVGVKSTAILFGRADRLVVGLCHLGCLLVLAALGWREQLRWPFYAGLAIAALLAARQQRLIKNREPAECFSAFLDNNRFGAVIFAGLVLALV
ncbi:MAG: 4-hydroxybenzoate octaprenyltransferase [Gammaproteobacteria bacterium]|nr:4-hydroxybenzoate octaprenyltransferase [Gammaproteobacteria bacterium]